MKSSHIGLRSPRFSALWEKLSETRFGILRHFTIRLSWLLRFTKPFGEPRKGFLAVPPFSKFHNKFYRGKNVILVILIKDLVDFKHIFVKYTYSMQWLGFKSRFFDSDTFFFAPKSSWFPACYFPIKSQKWCQQMPKIPLQHELAGEFHYYCFLSFRYKLIVMIQKENYKLTYQQLSHCHHHWWQLDTRPCW